MKKKREELKIQIPINVNDNTDDNDDNIAIVRFNDDDIDDVVDFDLVVICAIVCGKQLYNKQ